MEGEFCWVCTKLSNRGVDIHHPPPVGDRCKKKAILDGADREKVLIVNQFVSDLENHINERDDFNEVVEQMKRILGKKFSITFTEVELEETKKQGEKPGKQKPKKRY